MSASQSVTIVVAILLGCFVLVACVILASILVLLIPSPGLGHVFSNSINITPTP
jgi:hypothetical protein